MSQIAPFITTANDSFKTYDEVRKTALGRGNDYITGCLLDYKYFKDDYKLLCCNLSMQSILDSDPRAVQQIEFFYRLDNDKATQILTLLKKENETVLEFSKGTVKVL